MSFSEVPTNERRPTVDDEVILETESCAASASGGLTDTSTPEKKKMKRMCRYGAEWAREFSWSAKTPGNVFAAECCLCRRSVSVAHRGRNDLVQHSKTESDKQAVRAANSTVAT